MSTGAYEVIQLGELDDEGIPIIFIKWTFFNIELDE